MAIVQPLDLWEIFIVKLAGQDFQTAIFFFLAFIVIAVFAARFRMTAMSLFGFLALFNVIMYNANPAGTFVFMIIISSLAFVLMIAFNLKRIMD